MQKITPFLWFDDQAEEAAAFYTSVFRNSNTQTAAQYDDAAAEVSGQEKGSVMTVPFQIEGQQFIALNGGPHFTFTEAISFVINCDSQEEVDYYWDKLSEGGDPAAQQCGWLKDKFGVSWQVVPTILDQLASDADQAKADATMKAMLKMKKLDIATLQQAHDSVSS